MQFRKFFLNSLDFCRFCGGDSRRRRIEDQNGEIREEFHQEWAETIAREGPKEGKK